MPLKTTNRAKRYRKKDASLEDDVEADAPRSPPPVSELGNGDDDTAAPPTGENLEDLLELRKLRRRQHGIDVEKLQKGEPKKKKPKAAENTWKPDVGGLVEPDQLAAAAEEEEKESSVIKDNFTKQTNALDVDKHMMAFIETELKKRRGGEAEDDENEEQNRRVDPRDELYRTPDYLTIEKKEEKEENVTQSTAMLTAIPEVDLGIDARLRNIEGTERAKRQMMEEKARKRSGNEFGGSSHVATERFWRGPRRPPNEGDGNHQGSNYHHHHHHQNHRQHNHHHHDRHGGGRRRPGGDQRATDDLVVERFKKKMRKF